MNNANKISPTYYLSVDEFTIEDKIVLYIFVPESSQVHRCNGKIYDRSEDGDINITNHTNQVADLYQRKKLTHFENEIFQYVELADLRGDLIEKVRKIALLSDKNHSWGTMDDLELLKSAGLYSVDYRNRVEGFNLAAVLLFGKNRTLMSIIPYYRVDAILRKIDLDRYDDRDDIRTNLIESYDRLMSFISKHLPDPFYLEGDKRVSLREKIFREVISNILIHRDYSNPFPTKMVIGSDKIYTENGNRPHGYGVIDPSNFSPYPKNPTIAKFFKEIGLVDELGSGVRNIHKYCKAYFGSEPELVEGDIFEIVFRTSQATPHVTPHVTPQVTPHVTPQVDQQVLFQDKERIDLLLSYCKEPKSRKEMQTYLALEDRKYFRVEILNPLIENGKLKLTIPDKPRSSKQKYYSA